MDQAAGPSHMRRHGERYLPQFKERVIAYSRDHSFIETAKQFHVHHTTVSEWVRERDKGKEQDSPAVKLPTPEDRFREWLEPLCFGGTKIEKEFMLCKAQEILSGEFGNDWFSIWVKRVSDEERKSDGSHLIYPIWFKNSVCIYTKNFNQNESVKLFALSRKRISEWMQSPDQQPKTRGCKDGRAVTDTKIDQELVLWVKSEFQNEKIKGSVVCRKAQELYSAAGYKLACSKGWFAKWCQRHNLSSSPRVALDSNLEHQLIQWTLTQFDRQESVTHTSLRNQAAELVKASTGRMDFKVSPSWAVRFCRRHSSLIQQEAKEANFPPAMQQQAVAFRASLERMFFLGCMDELPLNFPSPLQGLERPVEAVAAKKLALLPRCPSEHCHAAIVLAALEDGRLLPPSLLIKESEEGLSEIPEVVSGLVHLLHQSSATMDFLCMRQWVQEIWFRHVAIPNALVVDCLDSHNDDTVRTSMAEVSCHLAVMPGGCSSLLQPLHCGGLAPWFMARLQERWSQHLAMLPLPERPLVPETRDLLHWLGDLYQTAQAPPQQEMIRDGFKSAGLRPEPLF